MPSTATQTDNHRLFTDKDEAKPYKSRWDNLRGRDNDITRERAALLHEAWLKLNRSDELLEKFLVAILGEFPGKHCRAYVRSVYAYDVVQDQGTWTKVGARGVGFLFKLNGIKRRAVMTKVRSVLASTGRETVSHGTFKAALVEVIGAETYRSILTERRKGSGTSLRTEVIALKGFLLSLIRSDPGIRRRLTREVRKILGVDLVTRRRTCRA